MASGIYAIENTKTGMMYIGQAKNIEVRWRQHVIGLNNQRHANRHLRKAWVEYGASEAVRFAGCSMFSEQYALDNLGANTNV